MDAVKEAEGLGIAKNYTVNYDGSGMGTYALYRSVSTITTASKNVDVSLNNLNLQSVYDNCVTDSKIASTTISSKWLKKYGTAGGNSLSPRKL